jgi:hypothetical protein
VTGAELAATIDDLAVELEDVRSETSGRTTTWSRASTPFAVLADSSVELRLDPAVAAAALKTPDTAPSPRGNAWVRYTPATLDDHDFDRLEAWFGLAHRRAAAPNART